MLKKLISINIYMLADQKVKKRRGQPKSYYDFAMMRRDKAYLYFGKKQDLISLAPRIRDFLMECLKKRPHEEKTLFDKLNNHDSMLCEAYDYMIEQAQEEYSEDYQRSRDALASITRGIEVRHSNRKIYWGLSSKLDTN